MSLCIHGNQCYHDIAHIQTLMLMLAYCRCISLTVCLVPICQSYTSITSASLLLVRSTYKNAYVYMHGYLHTYRYVYPPHTQTHVCMYVHICIVVAVSVCISKSDMVCKFRITLNQFYLAVRDVSAWR